MSYWWSNRSDGFAHATHKHSGNLTAQLFSLLFNLGKTITAVTPPVAHMLLGIEAFSHFTPAQRAGQIPQRQPHGTTVFVTV
jgi:hypothetical protein